jgi:hypothetical protein
MKTHHAPTVRGQPRVFQQLEGGAAIASRERHAWVGAMVDFLPSSSSGESPEGAGWLPRRPVGDGLKTQK